jgi:hypothetical protein
MPRSLGLINRDGLIAIAIGAAVFLFHAMHLRGIADAPLFQKSNLAFDFDVNRFAGIWCQTPFPVQENEAYYAVRHPLAVSVRLICMPLVRSSIDPHMAASGIAALCAAVSTALTYKIARAFQLSPQMSALFAALWAVSTTTLVLGVLPEAYGLSLVALAYQFLIAARFISGRRTATAARIATATAVFGITITNVVLSGLSEFVCRLARGRFVPAVRGTLVFALAVAIFGILLSAASFAVWRPPDLTGAEGAAKQVYWSAAAYSPDQRQGVANVAWEFAATSFVAPQMAQFPTGVEGNPYLWDLRGQNYTIGGWAAVLAWLGLLAYGAAACVKDRKHWPLWIAAGAWIAGNIGLHTYWQFRGSVFLYAAHSHTAFLLLAMAGALRTPYPRLYGFAVATTAVLMAWNNYGPYLMLQMMS